MILISFSFSSATIFGEPNENDIKLQENKFQEKIITWIDRCVIQGHTSAVRIIDHTMNKDPEKIEQFEIEVWSDSEEKIVTPYATETGSDTGIFEVTVFFYTTDEATSQRIRAFAGDTIFARHVINGIFDDGSGNRVSVSGMPMVAEITVLDDTRHGKFSEIIYGPCTISYLERLQKGIRAHQFEMFFPSPLKQIQSGLHADEVVCKESLALVTRNDGSPACVKKQSITKLIERGWSITNNEKASFETITPESKLATFYAQPQITSVILKQDSTIRVHLFSYIKEPDGWDMVFDRIFEEVPNNFKIGVIENTPENLDEFILSGKESTPSRIKAELLKESGYYVVYLTSDKSLKPGKYDLSVVSVDKKGTVIQKPLFVTAVNADTTSMQDNTVKLQFSKDSWVVNLENISESEYWIREDQRSPWPPSQILNITQENIHPDVKEMIDYMWSDDAKYIPSERDKNVLVVKNDHNFNANPKEIHNWLETTYVQQFKRNLDDSFSSYIKYDDKIYSFGFVIAD